jgi:CheY-like chemotaxis protein
MVAGSTELPVVSFFAASSVRFTASPRRVLIVEDDLDSVRILAELVKHIGHDVQYAINGDAALEIARRFKPHFVLLDLGLPGMDGYEVCAQLKQAPDPELRRSRVIVLSAYGQDQHRARTRAAGCELHLVKPVSPQALFDVLESSRPF